MRYTLNTDATVGTYANFEHRTTLGKPILSVALTSAQTWRVRAEKMAEVSF